MPRPLQSPYDIRKQDYSDTLLKEFGLSRSLFSETVAADYVLGEIGPKYEPNSGCRRECSLWREDMTRIAGYWAQELRKQRPGQQQISEVLLKGQPASK